MGMFMDPQMLGTGPGAGISQSLVKALLAKKGAVAPTSAPSMAPKPMPSAPGPVIAGPDLKSTLPVELAAAAPVATATGPGLGAAAAGLPGGEIKKPGMLDRIGDFLKSDEGRATMMRFAAGAFKGGFGGGLDAATGYADQRRHDDMAAAAGADERRLREMQIGNAYNLGLGRLDIDQQNANQTGEHYRRSDMNDYRRIDTDWRKHTTPSADKQLDVSERRFEHINPSGDAVVSQEGQNWRHVTQSADNAATQAGETARATARNQTDIVTANLNHPENRGYTETKTKNDGTPGGWFSSGTPNSSETITHTPLPSQVQPNMGSDQGVVTIKGDADYAALAPGTKFKGPDGQIRVKQ